MMIEPKVNIGIMSGSEIHVVFHGKYFFNEITVDGSQQMGYEQGFIRWQGKEYKELIFEPANNEIAFFELSDVMIGINFHWERKEAQRFLGGLKLIIEENKVTVINIVNIEEYLTSVISSEMSATASLELLKAHAVISRSWLMAQLQKKNQVPLAVTEEYIGGQSTDQLIRWFDREDHLHFDVCADDHCQRYQGITRITTSIVKEAIEATRGKLLMYNGNICDTRFSKCCGGAFEEFGSCWEPVKHPYLMKQRDSKFQDYLPNLENEKEADRWIRTSPDAFCNTKDKRILAQVLNNYDQETVDFYRWQVVYTTQELSVLIAKRTGIDFGTVIDLVPVERGTSGRLVRLKVIGTKRTMILGKELLIRRALSESHLYSSAFVVDKQDDRFVLTGAGWGHGVGLCQIGAAVMGEQGYGYNEILLHYYIGATIEKLYN